MRETDFVAFTLLKIAKKTLFFLHILPFLSLVVLERDRNVVNPQRDLSVDIRRDMMSPLWPFSFFFFDLLILAVFYY